MPDKRIIEHTATTTLYSDDYFLVDRATTGNDGGTRKIVSTRLKQLFGGNNFAGEWHSGTVYNKDSYVTHEGKLYHNIKGGSVVAVDWSSSQWEQVSISNELRKIVESLASTFDTSTNYSVDDLVIYNNTLYRCIVAHTAGTWVGSHFATVKVSSLLLSSIMDNFTDRYWENYSGSPVNYTKGTVIHKGLKLYRCKANTTNQSWDSSKWEQVDVTDLINSVTVLAETVLSNIAPTFSSLAQYNINDFVIYNNHLYVCMKPHHGSWDPLDFGTGKIGDILKGIFNNIADVYNPSNSYVKGDVVNYLGMPLKCIVDTATSPMVFSEWERVTFEQLIDEKVADVQIAGQTTTDENHISDLTSLAIEGTASGEIATFNDGADLPMPSFVCNIEAVQDLHGYDAPWVGGAGKNKLPMTVDEIKTLNTNGTWNENVYTVYGMTFTVNTDDGGNVTGIEANGTPSSFAQLTLTNNTVFLSGSFIGNGCPSGGGGNTYRIRFAGGLGTNNDFGSQTDVMTADPNTAIIVYIRVDAGATVDHLKFYPMIRLATETDPTFAPYENICPISGHTGVDAWVRGKNLANPATVTTLYPTGDSGTYPNQIRNSINARSVIAEVTPNTTYTISKKAGQRFRLAFTEEEPANGVADMGYEWNDTGTTITVTSPSNAKYMVVLFWSSNVDTDTEEDMLATLQIEIGETATTYEPYNSNSQTIQVSWQTEAGEVFGGYVDLVSGVLTVTDGYIDLGTCEWLRADLGNGNYRYYNTEISDVVKKPSSTSIMPNIECSHYKNKLPSQYNQAVDGITIYTNGSIQVYDSTKSALTTTDFKTAMDGVQLVYELETPITYQLTPQQIKSLKDDITNAWASTGNVNVKYNKDATTVINSLIARIEALENA